MIPMLPTPAHPWYLTALLLLGCAGQGSAPAPAPSIPQPPSLEGYDDTLAALIELAVETVRQAPDLHQTWLELGSLYEAHLMLEWAAPAYAAALECRPQNARIHYRLAVTLINQGELLAGLESLDSVHALAPLYAPAWCKHGLGLLELGRLDEAREMLLKAMEIDPTLSACKIGLAQIELQQGNPTSALAQLDAAANHRDPNSQLASRLRGKALFQLGRESEANRELARGKGARLVLNDPWSREVASFKRGTSAVLLRATRLMERGSPKKAVELLEELRTRDSQNPRVLRKLGIAHAASQNWEAAAAVMAQVVQLEPGDALIKASLAWTYIMGGDYPAALPIAREAVAQDPQDAGAHEALLTAQHRLGQFKELLTAFQFTVDSGQVNDSIEILAGKAALELGRAAEALAHFERAASGTPVDSEALIGAAFSEVQLGRKTQAQTYMSRVEKLAPKHEALAELRAAIQALGDSPQP